MRIRTHFRGLVCPRIKRMGQISGWVSIYRICSPVVVGLFAVIFEKSASKENTTICGQCYVKLELVIYLAGEYIFSK